MTHRLWDLLVTCAVALSCFGCPGDRAETAHEQVAPGPPLPKPASDPWLLHAHSVGGELRKLPKIAVDEHGNLVTEDPATQVRTVFAKLTDRELDLLKAALARAPQQVESHCEAPVDGVDLMLSFQRGGQWFTWECPRPENELTSVWSTVLGPHLAELPGDPLNGKPTTAPARGRLGAGESVRE